MSLDPEELKRRRQQQKARRLAAQRRLRRRLLIVAAVVLVCVALIVIFSLRGCNSGKEPAQQIPDVTAPTQSDAPEESLPDTTVIHFTAAGDLNITQRVVASGGAEYDYSQVFMDVAPLFANSDLSTVNLEGNLCGYPYGSNASAPQSMMEALHDAGVDMIQLANSYAIHRGVSGLLTTIDNVQSAGMEPVGAFRSQEEYGQKQGFSLFNIQGVRIAVVSFTKGMNGTTLPPGTEDCVNVLYTDYNSMYEELNTKKITQVMEAVQAQQPDITIALLHWGSEHNDTVSDSQKEIVSLLQEYGTDAVIGTHPHRVQQISYDAQNGTLVAYSLGDFFGDAGESGTEYSIILDLEITKNNLTGEASVTGYSYTPIFTVHEDGRPLQVVRIREAMAAYESGYISAVNAQTYEKMENALERIESRVAGE